LPPQIGRKLSAINKRARHDLTILKTHEQTSPWWELK